MRAPHLVAALLVTASLSACGGEDAEPRSDDEERRSSSSPTPSETPPTSSDVATPPPDTGDGTTIRQAIRRLLRDDTGFFSTTVDLGPAGSIERTGGFQRRPRASYSETVIAYTDSDPITIVSVAIGKRQWVKPVAEGERPICWIETDPATVSQSLGIDVSGSSGGYPAELVAVVNSRGGPGTGRPAVSDVYTMASLVTGKFTVALGLEDPNAFSPMPIEFELGNGEVRGWRTSVREIVEAAERAGADPDPAVGELIAAGAGEMEVVIDGGASIQPIQAPPAAETVTFTQDLDQYEADARRCAASLG